MVVVTAIWNFSEELSLHNHVKNPFNARRLVPFQVVNEKPKLISTQRLLNLIPFCSDFYLLKANAIGRICKIRFIKKQGLCISVSINPSRLYASFASFNFLLLTHLRTTL